MKLSLYTKKQLIVSGIIAIIFGIFSWFSNPPIAPLIMASLTFGVISYLAIIGSMAMVERNRPVASFFIVFVATLLFNLLMASQSWQMLIADASVNATFFLIIITVLSYMGLRVGAKH